MKSPRGNTKKKRWIPLWAKLSGALAVLGIVADGAKHLDDLLDIVGHFFRESPAVHVSTLPADWGGDCLQFEFAHLPETFRLSEIRLPITSAKIGNLPGEQAADLLQKTVGGLIDDDSLMSKKPINIICRITATRGNDAFFIKYCPVLMQRGEYAFFETRPEFYEPGASQPISNMKITLAGGKGTIGVTMSHPKNLRPTNSSDAASNCSQGHEGHQQ